ncbi:hypothetical protein TNCV_4135681, partial [Trichonephila clavipes]
GVWSPQTAKTAAHLFAMDDEVIDQTLGNTVPPQEVHFQVSTSSRRPWSRSNASSEYVPKHARLDSGQENTLAITYRCIVSASSIVLHQTSSMRSGIIIILENKGISNGYSVSG